MSKEYIITRTITLDEKYSAIADKLHAQWVSGELKGNKSELIRRAAKEVTKVHVGDKGLLTKTTEVVNAACETFVREQQVRNTLTRK